MTELVDRFYRKNSYGFYKLYEINGKLSFGWEYNPAEKVHPYMVWTEDFCNLGRDGILAKWEKYKTGKL